MTTTTHNVWLERLQQFTSACAKLVQGWQSLLYNSKYHFGRTPSRMFSTCCYQWNHVDNHNSMQMRLFLLQCNMEQMAILATIVSI